MKKIILAIMVVIAMLSCLTACGMGGGGGNGVNSSSTSVGGGDSSTVLITLETPVVTISENGMATWNEVKNANGYLYYVNGEEFSTSDTSVALKDGDSIKVMALGDGVAYKNSAFSKTKTYTAKQTLAKSTILQVLNGEVGNEYWVEGLVCATGAGNFLLTDNDGNYLYVYTQSSHGFVVGDFVKVVGKTYLYWDKIELKDITEATKISGNNQINVGKPVVANGAYLEEKLQELVVGEYISFVGTLQISGNYLNIKVEGLNGALVSLIYSGDPLEDGKTYTFTGYIIYLSGQSNKYINVIATSVKVYGEEVNACDYCGESLSSGNHSELDCGHRACQGGNHELCDY